MNVRMIGGVIFALAMTNAVPAAETVFELEKAAELRVGWRGQPLILAEEVAFGERTAEPAAGAQQRRDEIRGATVVNRWSEAPEFSWRREAAVNGDGSELEITFQSRVPSYTVSSESPGERIAYSFAIDAARLDGMRYKLQQGRTSKPAFVEGTFKAGGKDRRLYTGVARYLAFENDEGGLVFDFNPDGVGTYSDYGPGSLQGQWSAELKAGKLVFTVAAPIHFFGGTVTAKAIVFEGKFDDFLSRHVENQYGYSSDMDYERAYVFGAKKFGKFYTDAGILPYSAERKAGWLEPKNLTVANFAPSGAIYSAVGGSAPGTFKVSDLRPGVYLVTVRSAAYDQPVGPFKVELNGTAAASNYTLKPKEVGVLTFPVWIENGEAEFRFSGKWQLSSIIMQLLMHSREDYRFRRGIWLLDGYEPSVLFKNEHYAKEPAFKVSLEKTALAPPDFKVPENYQLKMKRETLLPPNNDDNAWRFSGILGSYGPGNHGDFDSFTTPAEKARRIDELAAENITSVIINGMLSRHTFPHHLDRVTRFLRDFTTAAHKKNLRVIDHQDLTLLWNHDSGFRVMTERTDFLQHLVDGDGVVRGFCLNNPHFKKEFFDRTAKLVAETGIDGIMVDETYFFTERLCGCRFCREKFTADTGLMLPMDETNPVLQNKKELLWKAWLSWRIKAVGDWWIDFRRAMNRVNPNLAMLKYTTHYGWGSTYGSLTKGTDLVECSRAVDVMGTEIMSRNVMVARRPVLAYRKMKTALNYQYGIPVLGLVYPQGDWSIAYFGWALNNMSRQSTWLIRTLPRTPEQADFIGYTGNYPLRYAKAAAETALVFSSASRDWVRHLSHTNEALGLSELLTDSHLMHDFILAETLLVPEKLKNFRNLVLPGTMCMSDAEIEAVRQFAAAGGTVVLTAHAGAADLLGTDRAKWPFADVFGFNVRLPLRTFKLTNLETEWGAAAFDPALSTVVCDHIDRQKGRLVGSAMLGTRRMPVAVEAPYGKGRMIYCGLPFGSNTVEREQTAGRKYLAPKLPELRKIGRDMFKALLYAGDAFAAVSIPEKVMVSTLKVEEPGQAPLLIVCLLNATGVEVADGAVIPSKMPNDWGKLTGPVVFQVKFPGAARVEARSPDFPGSRPVPFRSVGDGKIEITVSPDLLTHYTQIRID